MLRYAAEDIWTVLSGFNPTLNLVVVYHAAASAAISIAK
jgi:hypothetical protein